MQCTSGSTSEPSYSYYSPFEYLKLPPGEFTRYLVLLPGSGNEPLECKLRLTSLLVPVSYEAISYVWGTIIRDQTVLCDERILKITANLDEALRRFRYPDRPRNLWADSICINQEDMEEKSRQIVIMGQIYEKAKRVLMYVGSDCGEDGERVGTLLRDMRSSIEEELDKLDTSTFDTFPYPALDDPILTDPRWASMNRLVRTNWFRRGWVVREAALAQSGLLIWGQKEYLWDEVMIVLLWAGFRLNVVSPALVVDYPLLSSHAEAYCDRHFSSLQTFFPETQVRPSRLLDYLSHNLSFSDPRDRIYAFLDLNTEDSNGLHLYPDYDLSAEEVFRDFAMQYIHAIGDTSLLDYVAHFTHAPPSSLPSWVPRWDVKASDYTTGRYIRGQKRLLSKQGKFRRAEVIDGLTLKVHGVIFDSVRTLSGVLNEQTTTPQVVLNLWHLARTLGGPSPYPLSLRLEAFLTALIENSFVGDWKAWEPAQSTYMQKMNDHACDSSSFDWDGNDQNAAKLAFIHNCVRSRLTGTRFMITERGYMGLVPAVAQEGDMCGIIFGCENQSLLRPTGDGSSYQSLGSAFVLGRMISPIQGFGNGESDISSSKKDSSHAFDNGVSDVQLGKTKDGQKCNYRLHYWARFGDEQDKAWVDWVEEQDIYLR